MVVSPACLISVVVLDVYVVIIVLNVVYGRIVDHDLFSVQSLCICIDVGIVSCNLTVFLGAVHFLTSFDTHLTGSFQKLPLNIVEW